MRRYISGSRVLCAMLCVIVAAPSVTWCRQDDRRDGAAAVLWEGTPLSWFETGQVVVHEAEEVRLSTRVDSPADGGSDARPLDSGPTNFPTGIGLELVALRTEVNEKGQPQSPPRRITYGGVWVATPVSRDTIKPDIEDIVELLASGPLSRFEDLIPGEGPRDSARLFTSSGSPFFTEDPTWVCYERGDGSLVGRVLRAEPWTAPTGKTVLQTSIRSPAGYVSACASIRNAIKAGAKEPASSPTRLVLERQASRRLTFSLFRSYETTSEVTAGESYLALSEEMARGYMPSNPELDPWLASSAPVAMRFALEEAADGDRCQWNVLREWTVAVHTPKVDRPAGGMEDDLRHWEADIVELARTRFTEGLTRALGSVSTLDTSDLLSSPGRQSEGLRGGVLLDNLGRYFGGRSAVLVVCQEGAAVYSLFPTPATWMPIRNGDSFCEELDHTLSRLEPVSID